MHAPMSLNNGLPHDRKEVLCDLSKCSYFFNDEGPENFIGGHYAGSTVIACKLTERDGKADLFISIPPNLSCNHFFRARVTHSIVSTSDSHLSYHGRTKAKKESGEIHFVVDGRNVLKERSNLLEAPLAHSDDLALFPLPICRLEFSESIGSITPHVEIRNWFELSGPLCFFNTLDVYLAQKGFMASLLNGSTLIPNIVASIFVFTTLEIFKTGRLTRRRGRVPQVLILQTRRYELIVFAMQEAQHLLYDEGSLSYFHSRNYIKQLFNRFALENDGGYFIELLENESSEKPGFARVLDLL